MARVRSFEDLILDCRKRADMVNSQFVTDEEIGEWLNQELAELYNHIWTGEDKPHYRNSIDYTFPGSGLDSIQPLPFDFLAVQEVVGNYNGVIFNMQTFMASEHAMYLNNNWLTFVGPPKYRIQAGNIEVIPSNQTTLVTMYYTPCLSRLVNPSDVFDGVNGWEVAAIYGTVAQMLTKQESLETASFYESRKARILSDVDAWTAKRDAANPERVQETIAYDDGFGFVAPWSARR